MRMGADVPKQFLKVGSETIIEASVRVFAESPLVDKVVVTAPKEDSEKTRALLSKFSECEVIEGGAERQDSVRNALNHISPAHEDLVLVHDGVRPYCSQEIIERVLSAAEESGAAICGVPSVDSLRHVELGILDRSKIYRVQTPQGFTGEIIKAAYEKAYEDGFYGTDESGLVERCGIAVTIVEGSPENIKITTPEDLEVNNQAINNLRIGTGFDVHAFGELPEAKRLTLGGVEVPYELGLKGHSDADVLTHAIMDALLGAAALPDIGRLFPDNDPAYDGISSIKLLKAVKERLEDEGFEIVNVDGTIICERPKMAPHIENMRKTLGETLGLDISAVGLKATTTEKLGFTGRGEGIACEAICLLAKK